MTTATPAKQRHKLSDIQLDEISLVDRGANPGARIALFKRDEPFEKEAQSFNAVWNVQDVMDEWYEMTSALRSSIESILADGAVTDKQAAITASINQFKTAIVGEMEEPISKVSPPAAVSVHSPALAPVEKAMSEYDRMAAAEVAKILGRTPGATVQKATPMTAEQRFVKQLCENPAEYEQHDKERRAAVSKLQLE